LIWVYRIWVAVFEANVQVLAAGTRLECHSPAGGSVAP
jgi:hypothetical protein